MIWFQLTVMDPGAGPLPAMKRVLLVEDDFLVGVGIKSILERLGYEVVGPVASIEQALRTLETEEVDAAVLDINIIGGTSVPVAQVLQVKDRPFIFVTGYQSPSHMLPETLRTVQRLSKPVDERALSKALREATG
jgi:two-component SAPR family response regulator